MESQVMGVGIRNWASKQCFPNKHIETDNPADRRSCATRLTDYRNTGVLRQLRGLLVGRPLGYSAEEKEELRGILLEQTASYDFRIVTDMDLGHTAPQFTRPVGCRARIDTLGRRFEILEAAVDSGQGHPAIAST